MAKSRLQTAKDWLTILILSAGFIYLVLRSASALSEVLARPLVPGHIEPSPSELATIFFGASSLALIIFSLLLAAAAIIEWQSLKRDLERAKEAAESTLERAIEATEANKNRVDALEKSMKARNTEIETELRGRVDAVMGAMIGTLHSKPYRDTQGEEDRDFITEAIHHIRTGYDRLKGLEGKGKYMALNNLVYFTCLLGDMANRDEMLGYGKVLLKAGRESRPDFASPYLMTYCRVALVYSSDREELEQAKAIAQNLTEQGTTKLQKREARYLVASLTAKLDRAGAED